ncbi:hypothetical protein [Nocardia vaccinii]|uniref:hypothetical protein n=1 Tax=Nocardia vaccinii TaxID=1822 RepID=UPI00082B96F1|nr:hypothetical protein [Nocardia vaccinii]
MSTDATSPEPLAIRCIRPDLTTDRAADEQAMTDICGLLGYQVGDVVVITPTLEGPLVTVMEALAETGANTVIVPAWDHLYGIDRYLRDIVRLVSVASERTRQRAGLIPGVPS